MERIVTVTGLFFYNLHSQLLTPLKHQIFTNQLHLQSISSATFRRLYLWRTFLTENNQAIKTSLNLAIRLYC